MKKVIRISGIIIVIAFLAMVVLALSVDFDSPSLGNEVLARARETTGMSLKAAKFRLNLSRGLIWENVEASSRFPGGRYSVRIDRMILEHRVLPLLVGKILVRSVVLERPRIEVSGNQPNTNSELRSRELPERRRAEPAAVDETTVPSEPSRLDLALLVSDIQLSEATVTLTGSQPKQGGLAIQGLYVGLRDLSVGRGALTLLHALTASGEIRAGTFAMGTTRVRDLKGSMVLDRGRVELRDLVFTTDSGTYTSDLAVDFNRIPVGYAMSLEGGPLDVHALAALGEGMGLGPGHLELDVEGFGGSSKNIRGQGVLRLKPGRFPAHPILVSVDEALESKTFVDSRYEETEVQFRLEDDQVMVDHFHVETKRVALDFSGVVGRDGSVDLSVVILQPSGSVDTPGRFHITGSLKEPHINLLREGSDEVSP